MKFISVYDPAFKPYGKVLEGYDTAELYSLWANPGRIEEEAFG